MNHLLHGAIVLLALLAAGIAGVSLETSLFNDSGNAKPVEATATGDTANDTVNLISWDDLDIPFRTIGSNDAPPDRKNVLMHPKVRLFNGQEEFLSEQCVCQCKTRGARRLLRHRLR